MHLTKIDKHGIYSAYVRFEWHDQKRGPQFHTASITDTATALGMSVRTFERRLISGFKENELFLLRLFCCGRMDQFGVDWSGFRLVDGHLETPFGKRLHPNEIEQYTFYMSIAQSYKVELRKIKEENALLQRLLDHYSDSKVVELPNLNHKKSTA